MSNREGIEHFSHKAMLRKHLETGFNKAGYGSQPTRRDMVRNQRGELSVL